MAQWLSRRFGKASKQSSNKRMWMWASQRWGHECRVGTCHAPTANMEQLPVRIRWVGRDSCLLRSPDRRQGSNSASNCGISWLSAPLYCLDLTASMVCP